MQPGNLVSLVISKGILLVPVPNVTGMNRDMAVSLLKTRGFSAEVQEIMTDAHPSGLVFTQNPEAGKNAGTGSIVILQVAVTPKRVSVPNVVGLTLDNAKKKLLDAKLNVGFDGSPTATSAVKSQEPAAGTTVNENSEVKLSF